KNGTESLPDIGCTSKYLKALQESKNERDLLQMISHFLIAFNDSECKYEESLADALLEEIRVKSPGVLDPQPSRFPINWRVIAGLLQLINHKEDQLKSIIGGTSKLSRKIHEIMLKAKAFVYNSEKLRTQCKRSKEEE